MREAGLSQDQIRDANNALVGSPSFHDAIASLPPDLGRAITDAVTTGFTEGIAETLLVTGGIVLAALVAVRLLWPGRR
jgi:hypothetical protein